MTKEATFETADFFIVPEEVSYFSTPNFTSYYNNMRTDYEAKEHTFKKAVIAGAVILAASKAQRLHTVWPDIPNDYFRNYWPLLELPIELELLNDELVANWFRENMSYRTFFNMIYRHARRYGKALYQEDEIPNKLTEINFDDILKSGTGTVESILDQLALKEEAIYDNYINGNMEDSDSNQESFRAISILYHIAGHPNTSSETLARLASNDDYPSYVYRQVVLNPNTPEDIRLSLIIERGVEDVNSQLKDTLSQLQKMLKAGDTIVPETRKDDGTIKKWRWRLIDFHDNISYLYLMREIKNVEFTNNTIKNQYQEGSWNVYQPKDSVALAMWAQKVKNCIRSREDNVHSGDSEIVFIERNGVPAYTVEVRPGAPKRRNLSELNIKEIQAFGARTGTTRDNQGEILNMIKRAMEANV
jgi:hypothetical protein